MTEKEEKPRIIKDKLLFTALILFTYLLGREIPLYGINLQAYIGKAVTAEELLMQTIGGDTYRCSLLALGISPYMISSIFMQLYVTYKKAAMKENVSPRFANRLILCTTMLMAVVQALLHVRELEYAVTGYRLLVAQAVSVVEMVTGVAIIIWLSERNKKYGFGGQTALIYVNIMDGIIATLKGSALELLLLPLLVSIAVMFAVIAMENAQLRIPLQRISIHNIYADKNYLAIKLNPIGTMPVMFSTAFFSLPQILVRGLQIVLPNSRIVLWLNENLVLTRPCGIFVYIVIIYVLTVVFSMVFINPRDITEQFLKSGDSFLNIHAGNETRRFLTGMLLRVSLISATVMSLCLGLPLMFQYMGAIDSTLVMLPSSAMLLTGMWCNLYQEYMAVKSFESYQVFI